MVIPVCESLSQGDVKCGKGNDFMPYFWFNDSSGAFDKKFYICQKDSQEIFGRLLRTEYLLKNQIDQLDKKIRNARVGSKKNQTELSKIATYERSRENEKSKKQKAKEITEMNQNVRDWSEKKKRLYDILNDLRNKTCRLCGDPLKCDCSDCMIRQPNDKFSNCDLHSGTGYIREKIMLHTLCGRIWLLQTFVVDPKIRQLLLPTNTGQMTIEKSLISTDMVVN